MRFIGNILWLIFGGLLVAIEYLVASLALMLTIVGIPFGLQTLKLAVLALWPFGAKIRETSASNGCLSFVMNLIWILIGGIWISLTHLVFALLLAITIIGLPWAKQHMKLAHIAFLPFGHRVE